MIAKSFEPPSEYGLRPARGEDLDFCWEVHVAAMRQAVEALWGWDEDFQRRFFEAAFVPARCQIVLMDERPVGFLRVDRCASEIVLQTLELLPAWQSFGIGAAIVRDLLGEARSRAIRMRLQVLHSNDRARAFYERAGFVVVGRTDTHWLMECR